MRLKKLILLSLIGCGSASAAEVYNMFFLGAVSSPGFYTFDVNGTVQELLCDQFAPNVTTLPYQALGYTLSDLSGTTLGLQGDPLALHKYQEVAILDLLAYADPTLAPDVVRANRFIVDGSGPMTLGSQNLFNFVQTANPADYPQLSRFLIFVNPITQEQTGFMDDAPEPGTLIMSGAVLAAVMLLKRRRRRIAV